MPNELTLCAFALLRCLFHLDKKESTLFEDLCTYFHCCPIVGHVGTYKREVFMKDSGIPSGTGFTNLVGSIAHAIILAYHDPNWFETHHTMICGDDNLFFSNKRFTKQDLVDIYSVFGLETDLEETDIHSNIDSIYFLGYRWLRGIRVIDPVLCINRLVYHTSWIKDLSPYDRELARGVSIFLNGINGTQYLFKIFPEVESSLK